MQGLFANDNDKKTFSFKALEQIKISDASKDAKVNNVGDIKKHLGDITDAMIKHAVIDTTVFKPGKKDAKFFEKRKKEITGAYGRAYSVALGNYNSTRSDIRAAFQALTANTNAFIEGEEGDNKDVKKAARIKETEEAFTASEFKNINGLISLIFLSRVVDGSMHRIRF